MRRRAKIALGAGGTLVLAALAVHVPLIVGRGGGCPFGFDKAAPAGPIHHDPRLRGNAVAGVRPALGFTLGTTTRAEVARTVAANGGACRQVGPELECTRVPVAEATAWFTFDGDQRLDRVRALRRDRDAGAVGTAFTAIERDLTTRAGPPDRATGSAAPADLARGALRQAAVEYRFADYRAVVRATNVGTDFALTEEYQSLLD